MAIDNCPGLIQAVAIRLAKLQADGVPLPGSENLYVTDSIIEFTSTPVVREGEEIQQANGQGAVCINYKGPDTVTRYTCGIQLCSHEPNLSALLAGGEVNEETMAAGTRIMYQAPRLGEEISPDGVAIELWAKRTDGSGDLASDFPYERFAFPRVKVRHAEKNFANAPHLNIFAGFFIENPNFFDGPANDWPFDVNGPWAQMPDTGVPASTCGPQALAAS